MDRLLIRRQQHLDTLSIVDGACLEARECLGHKLSLLTGLEVVQREAAERTPLSLSEEIEHLRGHWRLVVEPVRESVA